VDVGISVSRVGGNAQIGAMKSVAGGLRLDLAAFRSLEAFALLGTELDKTSQAQLDRGYRMVEVLKQPPFSPKNVIDQVMVLFAGSNGYLDKVPAKQVAAWQVGNVEMLHKSYADDVMVVSSAWEPPLAGWESYAKAFQAQYARTNGGRMERSNSIIKVTGDNAWATYQWQFSGQVDGNPASGIGHTTLVLQKRAGICS